MKAKNADLENLHEIATKRLEEIKLAKQTLVDLKTSKKRKGRGKVEVTMEETTSEQNNAKIEAEEN